MRLTVILAASIAVLACHRESQDVARTGPPQTTTTAAPTTAFSPQPSSGNAAVPPQTEMPSRGVTASAKPEVSVELTEYAIRSSDSLAAGPTTFAVTNAGKEMHSLEIEGTGAKLGSELSRGSSGSLQVTLAPGTYTLFCPVKGHRARGMETRLTVK